MDNPWKGNDGQDHRLDCWFDGKPAVVLAPRHTGGDIDTPIHYIPICGDHTADWDRELSENERLQFISLFHASSRTPRSVSYKGAAK